MLVPYEVLSNLLNSMKEHGINITGQYIIASLALNAGLLRKLEEKKDAILSDIRRNRKEAEKILSAIIESSRNLSDRIDSREQKLRNTLLSYAIIKMNGLEPHSHLIKDALVTIPEVHEIVVDNKVLAIVPTEEELNRFKLDEVLRDRVLKLLDTYLKSIMQIDSRNGIISILDTELTVTDYKPLVRILYHLGRGREAITIMFEVMKHYAQKYSYGYAGNISNNLDDVVIEINKSALKIPDELEDVVKKSGIVIKAKLSPTALKMCNIYAEIESEIGVIRIPHSDAPIERVNEVVRDLASSVEVFLNRNAILFELARKAEELGYKKYTVGCETDKGFDITFEKEKTIYADNKELKLRTTIRVRKEWPLLDKLSARIKLENVPDGVKNIILAKMKETGLLSEYREFSPTISEGRNSITVELVASNLEDSVRLLSTADTVSKDITILMQQATTQYVRARAQKLTGENHLALYVVLSLSGVGDVIGKMTEYTGRTVTGIERVLKAYLEKNNVQADIDVIAKDPEKILEELLRKNIVSFNENLELTINGNSVADLLKPFRALERNYNVQVLVGIASARALKKYYEVKGATYALELLNAGKLTLSNVIKHVEVGVPVELEVLRYRISGKTVWEQLPLDVKAKELRLLPIDYVIWLEKDPTIPKTSKDYELIIEAVCRGANPSKCTEYIVTSHPEFIEMPRTLRLVEHRGGKWIDAGMYRVQLEKVTGKKPVFLIEEKLTGRLMRVKAKTIREAVYRATMEEAEEVIQ